MTTIDDKKLIIATKTWITTNGMYFDDGSKRILLSSSSDMIECDKIMEAALPSLLCCLYSEIQYNEIAMMMMLGKNLLTFSVCFSVFGLD
mmetsp:Transcript_27697/g.66742  ORF Transcript_27697/g.66742 Transcript_27697/m.66742 type:complete len:90 (-) Transcript_27697:244-513(-)